MNSLFTLIARDTTLTRRSAKHGGEYSGPCLLCRQGHRVEGFGLTLRQHGRFSQSRPAKGAA